MLPRRSHAAAAAAGLVLLLSTAACGDDGGSGTSGTGSGGGDDATTVEITFADGDVTPSGERVEVAVGEPVDLVITADEAGEIHVHSEPEQEFEYAEGETTVELELDRPGVVEVESHDLEKVIVSLEVK